MIVYWLGPNPIDPCDPSNIDDQFHPLHWCSQGSGMRGTHLYFRVKDSKTKAR